MISLKQLASLSVSALICMTSNLCMAKNGDEPLLALIQSRLAEAQNLQGSSQAPVVLYRELQAVYDAKPFSTSQGFANPEFGLKLSFFAWGERGALADETEATQKASNTQYLIEQNMLALDVYRTLINQRLNVELAKLLDDKISLVEKHSEVLRNYIKMGNGDVDSLMKSELEAVRTKTKRDQARSAIIFDDDGEFEKLANVKIADLATMQKTWNNLIKSTTTPSLKAQLLEYEHQKNSAAAARAQAARWRILNSVEGDMDFNQTEKNYKFKVTANIPFGDEKDSEAFAKRASAVVDLIRYRRDKRIALEDDALTESTLRNLFEENRVLAKIVKERKSSPTLIRKGRAVTDPLVIVQARLLVLEGQEQLLNTERNGMLKYLEWLARWGKLAEAPLKNYLAAR